LADIEVAEQVVNGITVGFDAARGAHRAPTPAVSAHLIGQWTLIDPAVAIVVDAVTHLHGAWVDVTVAFIAVQRPVGTRARAKAVAISVHAGPLALIDAGLVPIAAVIIDAVAADLDSPQVNSGIGVIAVLIGTAAPEAVAVLVEVSTILI
jgi:hypothetical protein